MECPSCGNQQDSSGEYCGNCGSLIAPRDDVPGSESMFEQAPAPDTGTAAAGAGYDGSFSGYPAPGPAQPTAWPAAPHQVARTLAPTAGQQPLRFRLAHGEQVLKAYDVVTLCTGLFRRQRGHGTLYVTDARVIFYVQVYPRGTQKASWLFQQTKLEDISGLSAHVSRRVSLGLLVLTLFCGLATIGTLVMLPLAFLFAILTVVFAILLVRDANRRGDVGVIINSRENDNSPIAFGHLPQKRGALDTLGRLLIFPVAIFLRAYSAFDVMAGDPADHANDLLHEVGALIIDLQTRGTMAYPDWDIAVPAGAVGSAGTQ